MTVMGISMQNPFHATSRDASMGSPSVRTRRIVRGIASLVLAIGLTAGVMTGAYALVGTWG